MSSDIHKAITVVRHGCNAALVTHSMREARLAMEEACRVWAPDRSIPPATLIYGRHQLRFISAAGDPDRLHGFNGMVLIDRSTLYLSRQRELDQWLNMAWMINQRIRNYGLAAE